MADIKLRAYSDSQTLLGIRVLLPELVEANERIELKTYIFYSEIIKQSIYLLCASVLHKMRMKETEKCTRCGQDKDRQLKYKAISGCDLFEWIPWNDPFESAIWMANVHSYIYNNTHLYLCRIEWKCQRLIARSFDNFVWLLFIRWTHSWLVLGTWYMWPIYCVYRASSARTNKLYWWWQCVRDGEKECKDHTNSISKGADAFDDF